MLGGTVPGNPLEVRHVAALDPAVYRAYSRRVPRPLTPDALKRRRKSLGLTQTALAKHLGVSSNTVARWERGEMAMTLPAGIAAVLTLLEAEKNRSEDADLG